MVEIDTQRLRALMRHLGPIAWRVTPSGVGMKTGNLAVSRGLAETRGEAGKNRQYRLTPAGLRYQRGLSTPVD